MVGVFDLKGVGVLDLNGVGVRDLKGVGVLVGILGVGVFVRYGVAVKLVQVLEARHLKVF